jgi:NADH:ubiquinone oxidoreductase subunit 6 (subunit J)
MRRQAAVLLLCTALVIAATVAAVQRRAVPAFVCLVGAGVCACAFWRLLDMNEHIVAAMLVYSVVAGSVGGLLLSRAMSRGNGAGKARPRTWLVTTALLGSIVATAPCAGFLLFMEPFRMWDETQQTARSPDGAYTAKLLYKDGLTFGFQHVTIDMAGRHVFGGHADIAELASEGADAISWSGNRTLVISYDATRHKDPDCDTMFVSQLKSWRDVHIEYRPVTNPENEQGARRRPP